MSFANQNARWTYSPNGVTTAFGYDNKVLAAADLEVTWVAADGSALVLPGYSVTGVGNATGGTVLFNSAPATTAGSLIVIERKTAATQEGTFLDFLQEPAETRQQRFERGMALAQEFKLALRRLLLYSPLDADGAFTLPPAATRANKALLFGPTGLPVVGSPLASGVLTVSAYIQTLLDDSDGPSALATLGFSAFMRGLAGTASAAALLAAIGAADAARSVGTPGGRLTLVTGTAVMTGAATGRTIVYYTPHVGQLVPVWNGVSFANQFVGELTNDATQAATGKAGPAAVANNSNYDFFVWSDNGTLRLTRGPAWTSDGARGAGAGTTELIVFQGLPVNRYDIANGPAAGTALYVGSGRSNGAATFNFDTGGLDVGGRAAIIGLWNCFNRVSVDGLVGDTTDSWSYGSTVIRPANNSLAMRVSMIAGLPEDFFAAEYAAAYINDTASTIARAGIGYDSIAALTGRFTSNGNPATVANGSYTAAGCHVIQPTGFHFMQALEGVAGGGTNTWLGDGGGATQSGLTYRWSY